LPSSFRGGKPAIALVASSRARPCPWRAFSCPASPQRRAPARRQWRHRRSSRRPAASSPRTRPLRCAVHRGPRPTAPARPVHRGPGPRRPSLPRSTMDRWTATPPHGPQHSVVDPPTVRRHVAGPATAPAHPYCFAKRPLYFSKINPRFCSLQNK